MGKKSKKVEENERKREKGVGREKEIGQKCRERRGGEVNWTMREREERRYKKREGEDGKTGRN